jgi:3-phenylpropionate/trans-cinnamate dioxygenase ferredoxin subunit
MSQFFKAAKLSDVPDGGMLAVDVNETAIALTKVNDVVHAFGNVCTHDDGPLDEGTVAAGCVECPRHGARFDLKSGKGTFPAAAPIPIYQTKIDGEWVLVSL